MINIELPQVETLETNDGTQIGRLIVASHKYEKELAGLDFIVKKEGKVWYLQEKTTETKFGFALKDDQSGFYPVDWCNMREALVDDNRMHKIGFCVSCVAQERKEGAYGRLVTSG